MLGLSLGVGLMTVAQPIQAKSTALPAAIRQHTWVYTASGTEGGFHIRTTVKRQQLRLHVKGQKDETWRFSHIKKHSRTVYYAHVKYSRGGHDQVKLKLVGKKEFLMISKHHLGFRYSKKAYAGTADYGAVIFNR